jgi:UDPglucose--hexose-1-phosphate uridylyltransferase
VSAAEGSELRVDPLTGAPVQIAGSRQSRPNLPAGTCPFCIGGTEAPEPYDTKAFVNRWPSFPADRGEVVLYSPRHGETLASLGEAQTRKVVDLWAERTSALGARDDIAYVLVFENHGPEVGATITHPHGQIFAFPSIPPSPATELQRLAEGHRLLEDDPTGERIVVERAGWRAWVPAASIHPYGMRIAPLDQRPDLPSLDDTERDALTAILVDALGRLERLFTPSQPYMFWFHQRPSDGGAWPQAWLHLEVAAPWRAQGVMRFVAGGELGSGVFINPMRPDAAAAALREA